MKLNLFKGKKANAVMDFILNILIPMAMITVLTDGWDGYSITTRIIFIALIILYIFLIPFAYVALKIQMRRKRLNQSK